MDSNLQRIAIAEFCGIRVDMRGGVKIAWDWQKDSSLPDYLNDLNAMHEAEKILTHQQEFTYHNELHKICGTSKRHPCYEAVRACAADRAQALLRVLGKWTE